MTDDTTTTTDETTEAEAPKRSSWAQRTTGGQTYLDRYVMPFLIPLIAVVSIIFFVTNVSRALLSGHGNIALIVASLITVVILIASASLSAATKMRSQSLAVFASVSALAIMFIGFLTVGHAQEKKEATVEACTPVESKVDVVPLASIKLDKSSYTAKAGCVEISYIGASGHTLAFIGGGPTGPALVANEEGKDRFAWTLAPGTYKIHCTITGHEAMAADLVVS